MKAYGMTDESEAQLRELAIPFGRILEHIMIQRGTKYEWFGKNIIDLPPHEDHDIMVHLTDAQKEAIGGIEAAAIEATKAAFVICAP
ncbi:hypothetical protein FQN50_007506 [Emmonsiellopsis sp. PD_5]|nr:hypothetical protein FQN50_007506 [Emmonsiellopsis sp. PD_5]